LSRSRAFASVGYFGCLLALATASVALADAPDGAALYRKECARCHGPAGEGAKAYPHPLAGKRTLPQLTKYIAHNMPEDKPGTCTGADAEKVAAYIFDAFYSPAAQARLKRPKVELAHLTVSEYRNAVADLVGTFRPARTDRPRSAKEEYGLRGEYTKAAGRRNRTPLMSRTDPSVRFDFGPSSPDFEKVQTDPFAVTWQGSVLPSETGFYDFIVRTEHSTRLWVNDLKRPLIDAGVKSGSDTEFQGSIFLLAGRAYPVKLEFSRATLGVRKEAKKKPPPVKTTIALLWKAPNRAAEVIPPRHLTPATAPATFAISIPMPPDDRSAGYERGNAVSKAWVEAATNGAIETAGYVVAHLAELSGVRDDDAKRKERLKEFCVKFAERAFRRPLTPDQKRLYVDRQFDAAEDAETAVQRVVLLVMQSPRFLYREPGGADRDGADAFDVASRISFGLWDSLPDQELLAAAAAGRLKTRADVVREARRLIADPRARAKVNAFFMQWLKLDQVAEVTKDKKKFRYFDAAVASDLRTSLELFLDETMWSEASDFRRLFLADHLYLNGRLAKLYGGDLPADAPFQKVTPKAGERAGVLSHPYLMANLSYTATSSPIHRGVFLARNVLGVTLRPPPDAFAPLPPELHPDLSTRERIALQTKPTQCASCHSIINPLGFSLERYDAIGRFRQRENNKPVDASGSFVTRGGDRVKFVGARELAKFVVASDEAQEAFVARLFHFLVKQPIPAYGPNKLADLRRFFADNRYNMRDLAVEIIAETALPATKLEARNTESETDPKDRNKQVQAKAKR
jgi:hypothetical protein